MSLDEKMIKRLIVCMVIFIVVVFIAWRWRTKSKYVYPETTTAVGTFTVTVISTVSATATAPSYLKVKTSTPHGFVASGSARDTVIFRGFTGANTGLNSPRQMILYNASGLAADGTEFAVLVPPTVVPTFNTGITVETGYNNYKNLLQAAVTTYNQSVNDSALGIYLAGTSTKTASDALALTNKQAAYAAASTEYVTNKCPYGSQNNDYYLDPSGSGKPAIPNDPARALYDTYRLTSGKGISKIQNDYNSIITSSTSTAVTAPDYYKNTTVVQQARKADITGATRAYLSTVCPGFYTDTTGSTVETTFRTWDIGATTYGYNAPTTSKINNWATYAVDTSVTGFTNSDGKLVLSVAKDLKGVILSAGGVTARGAIVGSSVPSLSGITSVTGGTTTATVTTPTAHGLVAGSKVIMSGFTPDTLNGTYVITVPSTTTFTIPIANAPAATALGVITPLVAASATTSPQLVVYTVGTGPTSISKPAWQWARDFGPGTTATTLLPTELQGWANPASTVTTSMLIDTTTYV